MASIIVVLGNLVALIAAILMVYSGYIKQKDKIIYVQTIQIGMFVLSNIILGGITGAIINAISCIRNILCYKEKLNNIAKAIIITASISLSLCFNNLGIIGLLPVVSTVVYILFMNIKDIIKFKYLVIFTMIMWIIYDFFIKSYVSCAFDALNIIANIVSIIQINSKKKNLV